MKTTNKLLVALITATIMASVSAGVFAQTTAADGNKTRQRFATKSSDANRVGLQDSSARPEKPLTDDTVRTARHWLRTPGQEPWTAHN